MDQLFKIFQVSPEDAIKFSAHPNEPHSHNFEELIIGIEGELEHFIDFKTTKMEAPLVSFITKGKFHRLIPKVKNNKCKMWVIRFKSEFIPETTFQLYSYYHDHANIKMPYGKCFDRMVTLCEIMFNEMRQTIPDFYVISHLLIALFAMVESERKKSESESENEINKTQNSTFQKFLKILEDNFKNPAGVEFYAEKLFMTPRNLNIICQNILHQSISEIIETRKLIEAKNLLINSDKNISEIAYDLGYNEKAYFTNVFRKKSGQTPTEFRNEMKKII